MKINQPVTNVETLLPEGQFIYSSTDLRGVIIEANEAFATISNFTRDEMVGQSHHIVRHPDMPPEAFADMWCDIKAGRPWRGIVKNRRKDGGFYWVVANVSPVREDGQVIGYQSVRARPTRDEIATADSAYRRIRAGDQSICIESGRVVTNRPAWILKLFSLRSQMGLAGLLGLLPAIAAMSNQLGGPALPDLLSLFVSSVAMIYFLYFLLHYLIAIKVEGKILFSNKVMLGCSAGIFSAVILGNVLIDHIILRILVVLLLCGAGLIHEEKTLGILKRFWRSNR